MATVKVKALDHLVLTVANIAVSCAFYTDVLGMRAEVFTGTDGTKRHALAFGNQKINLHEAGSEFAPHAKHPKPGSGDLCFLTEGSVADAVVALRASGVEIIDGPVRRTGALGPVLSVYFRDPDDNLLELSEQL